MSPDRLILPTPPPTVRHLTNAQITDLERLHPSRRRTWCPTCQDTKVFTWYADPPERDLSRLAEYDCDCSSQYLLYRRFLYSGILNAYQRLDWYDIMSPEAEEVMTACLTYADRADARIQAGLGMMFWGPRGTGKTMAVYLLAKDLVLAGHDVYCQTFDGMLEIFSDGWEDKERRQWFHDRIRSVTVLVMDDLGRENRQGRAGDMGNRTLEQVLRYRVQNSLPTIFTTNQSPENIEAGYGGHTMSLLSEQVQPICVTGADFRKQAMARKEAESDAGVTRPVLM